MNQIGVPQAGVMGWPIEHSLSPRLHNYWLNHNNIKGYYVALPVMADKLEDALEIMLDKDFRGVNLTVPHKESALQYMAHLDPLARRIGAINTVVVRKDGMLEGRNTDAYGFTQNLIEGGYKVNERPVAILGAGGAARAAIVALQMMGVHEIRIINRTAKRAEELAQDLTQSGPPDCKIAVYQWPENSKEKTKALADIGLLINATSLGLKGQPPLELNLDHLPHDAIVTDMVYAPLITGLLQKAERRGNAIIDGLGMLLHQARPAFKAFFGYDPEVTQALRAYVLDGMR